jgi:dTDP-glucose 4,6-dehydratase
MRSRIHKILITGGAGFIASEFIRQNINKKYRIIVVDKLTYAGDMERLKSVKGKIVFYKTDIGDFSKLKKIFVHEKPTQVIHFAAETHVDRSIHEANPFIITNIIGTQNLIECSRLIGVEKFVHISTDEVYGESNSGKFHENLPLKPNNPYSATKASAELLLKAARRTYNFPVVIVRPSNNYGPWQYPEKFIPVIFFKALNNQKVPVYGQGKQIREWLYVGDCAQAIELIRNKGKIGEIYNIGSYFEMSNLKTAQMILTALKKPLNLIQFVQDRPGHDFRYSVDCSKLHRLGWRPKVNFETGIKRTLKWYTLKKPWAEKKLKSLRKLWSKVYQTKV